MRASQKRTSVKELFYGSVTIGERGQVVIPAEARKRHHFDSGDKLLVFSHPNMHGVVLARLDEMEMLLGELRQWIALVEQARESHAPTVARKK